MICPNCSFPQQVIGITCKICHKDSQKYNRFDYKEIRKCWLDYLDETYPTKAKIVGDIIHYRYVPVSIELLQHNKHWIVFYDNVVLEKFKTKNQAKKFCRILKLFVIDIINHKLK